MTRDLIALLPTRAAANAFIRHMHCADTFAGHHRYVTKVPIPMGELDLDPHGSLDAYESAPKWHLDRVSRFLHSCVSRVHTQTHRPRYV